MMRVGQTKEWEADHHARQESKEKIFAGTFFFMNVGSSQALSSVFLKKVKTLSFKTSSQILLNHGQIPVKTVGI
jgi:hypothetical protein